MDAPVPNDIRYKSKTRTDFEGLHPHPNGLSNPLTAIPVKAVPAAPRALLSVVFTAPQQAYGRLTMDNEGYRRFMAAGDSDRLVDALSEQQFLKPHQTVKDAVNSVVGQLGVCPDAARVAMEALRVEPATRVGRMRRTELMQLGRALYRHWRQAVVEETTPSQPS